MTTLTSPRRSLWHHRNFRFLWAGDAVSVFGFSLVALAMPLMALQILDAGAFEMGLLTTLEMLAFLLIGLPAGAWVDRWRKRRIIVVGDLVRGALLLTLPAAYWLDALTLLHLYAVAFLVGCITVFFDVANQSYLPEILESEALSEGNSKLQATQMAAQVGGPTLAATLVRLFGSPLTIAATSICMALSSLFVSRIDHVEERKQRVEGARLRTEISEGLSFVVKHPLLVRIVACTGISNMTSQLTAALMVLYVIRTLGLSETTLGLIFSVTSAGGLLGAVTADRVARWVGEGRSIPLTSVLFSVAALNVPLASYVPPVPVLIVGGFVASYAVVVYNVVQVSFRQRLCPKPLLGRMNASIRFLVWGPIPIGAFLGGVLGATIGVLPAIWLGSALNFLCVLPVAFSPLITMREMPRELDAHARAESP